MWTFFVPSAKHSTKAFGFISNVKSVLRNPTSSTHVALPTHHQHKEENNL